METQKELKDPDSAVNESIDDKIKRFPPLLKKILNYRYKNTEGLSLYKICALTSQSFKSVTDSIYKQKKKDNNFYILMNEIEQELVLDRKIELDNKFYSMVCEEREPEQMRKSIKTFYELNKLIVPDIKPVIQTIVAINIPISLKDVKPTDLDE